MNVDIVNRTIAPVEHSYSYDRFFAAAPPSARQSLLRPPEVVFILIERRLIHEYQYMDAEPPSNRGPLRAPVAAVQYERSKTG